MIIPNMTPAEVVAEARKDIPSIMRKLREPLARLQRQHMKGDRSKVLEVMHTYRSQGRNNWLIMIRVAKKGVQLCMMTYYRGVDQKLRAAIVTPKGTCYHFSAHVIERYGERFDSTNDPVIRLQSFFRENYLIACETLDQVGEQEFAMVAGMAHGMAMGTWDRSSNVICLATFINHGQLSDMQAQVAEKLDIQRELSVMSHGQRIDLLNAIKRRVREEEAAVA